MKFHLSFFSSFLFAASVFAQKNDKIPQDLFANKIGVVFNIIDGDEIDSIKQELIRTGFRVSAHIKSEDQEITPLFQDFLLKDTVKYIVIFPSASSLFITPVTQTPGENNSYQLMSNSTYKDLFNKFDKELQRQGVQKASQPGSFPEDIFNLQREQKIVEGIPTDYKNNILLIPAQKLIATAAIPEGATKEQIKHINRYNKSIPILNRDILHERKQMEKTMGKYPYPYKIIERDMIRKYDGKDGYYMLDKIETIETRQNITVYQNGGYVTKKMNVFIDCMGIRNMKTNEIYRCGLKCGLKDEVIKALSIIEK